MKLHQALLALRHFRRHGFYVCYGNADLASNERWAVDTRDMLQEFGISIVPKERRQIRVSVNEISCVGLLFDLYSLGGIQLLRQTFQSITQGLNERLMPLSMKTNGLHAAMVSGVAYYILHATSVGKFVGVNKLATALATYTPDRWLEMASDACPHYGNNRGLRKAMESVIRNHTEHYMKLQVA